MRFPVGRRPRLPGLVPVMSVLWLGSLAAACGSSTTAAPAAGGSATTARPALAGKITVAAAASLTEPFKELAADFTKANPGTEVTFSFDASSALTRQIQSGAPVDVFASADQANMQKLVDARLVADPPSTFARNTLTIVVKRGNPVNVHSVADLAKVGTVSLCGSEVPCGTYADEVLKRSSVALPPERVTRGQNAKATLGAVADGDADAAIVYVTDAVGSDKVEAVPIPDDVNQDAVYPIAIVATSPNQAVARAFVEHVRGPVGQQTLRAARFLPP